MIHRKIGALVAGSLLGATIAQADYIQVGNDSSGYGPYQSGEGGEFTITPFGPISDLKGLNYAAVTSGFGYDYGTLSFQSFCIEQNEYIYPNSFASATLSDSAVYGGVGGAVNGADPLSLGTAWLYKQFALGTLAGYDFINTANRKADADALQQTIWWLEDELTTKPNNEFTDAVIAQFGSEDKAKANNNGTYGVAVLHITYEGSPGQDQLVSVPDGGFTGALLGLSLAGLGLWRRKQI